MQFLSAYNCSCMYGHIATLLSVSLGHLYKQASRRECHATQQLTRGVLATKDMYLTMNADVQVLL